MKLARLAAPLLALSLSLGAVAASSATSTAAAAPANQADASDVKGYASPQTEAKFAAFPHPLLIIRKHNLQFVFDRVIEKHGRNFTRLYE